VNRCLRSGTALPDGSTEWYRVYNPDRFVAVAVVCGLITPIRDYYRAFVEDRGVGAAVIRPALTSGIV
jgi:hypothetical protein